MFFFVFISVGAMSFGTSVYIYTTPILGPIKASAFIFTVPFFAACIAYIFIGEPIMINMLIGGILSLIGVYMVNQKK